MASRSIRALTGAPWCAVVTLALLPWLGGCPEPLPQKTFADAGMPEPIVPSARPSEDGGAPAWLDKVPTQEARLPPGSRVWATVPRGKLLPDVGVYTVDGAHAGRYGLTNKLGQGFEEIPAAFVHPVGKPDKKLMVGEVVLFHTFETPALLGRVSELVPGGDIRVSYDWGGVTKDAAVDHAEAPRGGLVPMAVVSFPKGASSSRGLLLASADGLVWVRSASGHVEVLAAGRVKPLPLPPEELKVGDSVEAFRWATGFRKGTVVEELEPGLRYRVRHEADRSPQDYFFSSLVARR